VTKKHQEEQEKKKWERSTSTMKERKPFFQKKTNTKTMNRREQVDYVPNTPEVPTPQI
jgi:hypothetical protein